MLSIIIPTHNEAKIIEQTIKEILKIEKAEIIISDGGSTDSTINKVKKLQKKHTNIKLIQNKTRGRKGGDIEEGIKNSSYNNCIFVDADLSCDKSGILEIAKELDNYDLVIGSRNFKDRALLRNFLSKGYIKLVNAFFGMKIKDYQSGIKGFRKKKIIPVLKKIKNKDLFWDTELVIRAHQENLRMKQVPITWTEKRKSKIKAVKTSLIFFIKLIELRL